jgi:hypothetical protein
MNNKTKKPNAGLYLALALLSSMIGVMAGRHQAAATTPLGESSNVSGAEQPASTWFDEYWQADKVVVSWGQFNAGHGHHHWGAGWSYGLTNVTDFSKLPRISGQLMVNNDRIWTVTLMPQMRVTRWAVHGHMHLQ